MSCIHSFKFMYIDKGECIVGLSMRRISLKDGHEFDVDLTDDFYSNEFWDLFEKGEYEPDTCDYLRRNLKPGSLFIDIGAANGSLTLYAACLGANVEAYEPLPIMFKVLSRNVKANAQLTKRIDVKNKAVSTVSKVIELNRNKSKGILTDIVYSNVSTFGTKIEIESFSEVVNRSLSSGHNEVVIKIDIEGAEYEIFKSPEILNTLCSNKIKVLVAFHPGFTRAKSLGKLTRIPVLNWLPRVVNFVENIALFKCIDKFGVISRTNRVSVSSKFKFALMLSAGIYEFEITFPE